MLLLNTDKLDLVWITKIKGAIEIWKTYSRTFLVRIDHDIVLSKYIEKERKKLPEIEMAKEWIQNGSDSYFALRVNQCRFSSDQSWHSSLQV